MEGYVEGRFPWNDGSDARWSSPQANLAIAIIKLAVDDYIKVLVSQKRASSNADAYDGTCTEKLNLEQFFYSDQYEFYAGFLNMEIPPDVLIRNCAIRAEEKYQKLRKQAAKTAEGKKEE